MTDSVRVEGPINVAQNSRERVAFELMEKIGSWDEDREAKKSRQYWLNLYHQCYRATLGTSAADILKNG